MSQATHPFSGRADGGAATSIGWLAIALPFLIAFSVSPSSTYFNQALSFGGCAAWLFWWALQSGGFTGGRSAVAVPAGTRWILLALVVLALAMIPPGAPIGQRLMPMGCVMLAAALVYAAARTARTRDDLAFAVPLMSALLAAGIASLVIGGIQVFFPDWADGVVVAVPTIAGRAIGNMRQPNQLSTLLMWAIAAAVWLGLRSRWPKGLLIGVVAGLVFGVALTASRTGTVGIMLLAVWGLIDRRLPGWVRLLLLACLPLYALSWWGLEQWLSAHGVAYYGEDQIKKTLHGDASSSRGRIWSNAWAMVQAHPWFGTGVGAFNFVWSMTPFPDRPVAFFDHTHNIALQLAAEFGIPIAAVVLLALLWGIGSAHPALRAAEDDRARGARAALFMLVLVGVHSLLEYPLWYSYFLMPTALLAGWLTGSAPAEGQAPAAAGDPRRLAALIGRVGLPACLIVGLLGSVATLWATAQYAQVAVIFEPELAPGEPKSLDERIARGQRSLFFGHHADYAKVTMAEHPEQVFDAFERPLYHLMDTRITLAYARALAARGELERARHVAARLKEFHNPGSEDFFVSCDPASAAAAARARPSDAEPRAVDILAGGVPFQCTADPRLDAAKLVPEPRSARR